MFRWLLPREYAFNDYLERLISINRTISNDFLALAKEKNNPEVVANEIQKLEGEANQLSQECIDLLHKTFVAPIKREQIHQLVIAMNGFAEQMNGATLRLSFYGIEELRPDALEFAKVIQACIMEIEEAIKGLRNFKKNSASIRSICAKIHEYELKADDISRIAILNLLKTNESQVVIKWKDIFERMEKAVERIKRMAYIIESVLIDNRGAN